MMSALIDAILVSLALAASLAYVVLALGPKSWRRRLRSALGLKPPAAQASSCGGCEGCGSEPKASVTASEIKIPVAKIGRR